MKLVSNLVTEVKRKYPVIKTEKDKWNIWFCMLNEFLINPKLRKQTNVYLGIKIYSSPNVTSSKLIEKEWKPKHN